MSRTLFGNGARAVFVGALVMLAVAPQVATASTHAKARYHVLADAIAKRSCRLWAPGDPSLGYRTAGRINVDYLSYVLLARQYTRVTQGHLLSWDAARSRCDTPHSVSTKRMRYSTKIEMDWVDQAIDASDHGLDSTAAGSAKHEIWFGFQDELHVLYTRGSYFSGSSISGRTPYGFGDLSP